MKSFKASESGFNDVDYDKATIKNNYGEKIHIKFENDRIYIHLEDATDDFITLDDLFKRIIVILDTEEILNNNELRDIEFAIKKIFLKNELKEGNLNTIQ